MRVAPNHTLHATGRERWLGHAAMLAFALFVAGSFPVGARIVGDIESAPLNAVRFALAALLVGLVAFGVSRNRLILPAAPWRFAIYGALNGTYFVTMMIALTMASPVSTSAVFTLTPLLTAVIAFIVLRQRVSPVVGFSIALAAVGALWVIFEADIGAVLGFALGPGEAVFLLGCFAYALVSPLMRKLNRNEPGLVLTFWLLVGTTLAISIYGAPAILATDWQALPPHVWWGIAYLTIFPTALSVFLLQYASLRMPSSKVMAYAYLLPGFVIVFEGLAGGGWASVQVMAGAGLTVAALIVLAVAGD